jgi:hypothetical protein
VLFNTTSTCMARQTIACHLKLSGLYCRNWAFQRTHQFASRTLQGGKMDDITVVVAHVAEEEVKVPRPVPEEPEAPLEHTDAGPVPGNGSGSSGGSENSGDTTA